MVGNVGGKGEGHGEKQVREQAIEEIEAEVAHHGFAEDLFVSHLEKPFQGQEDGDNDHQP